MTPAKAAEVAAAAAARGAGGRRGHRAAARSSQGVSSGHAAAADGRSSSYSICIEHCAVCIDFIRRRPAGRAAVQAHPLAAEAIVATLERLRGAPPGSETILVMGSLLYTAEQVYTM